MVNPLGGEFYNIRVSGSYGLADRFKKGEPGRTRSIDLQPDPPFKGHEASTQTIND